MNTPSLCSVRAFLVRLFILGLAGLTCLAPVGARAQFATLLDTTARFAGNSTGSDVFNGDTGVATATTLNVPTRVVFDSLGNLYISDTQNNCVRKVDTSGNITTVAGLRVSGNASDTCDSTSNPGPNPTEGLLSPTGLAIDSSNTLYIADSQHNCVRSLASGVVDNFAHPALNTVAGACTIVSTDSDTPIPIGLAVDSSSNLYISINDSLSAIPVYQVVRHLAGDPAITICAVAGQLSPDAANTLCPGIVGTVTLNRPAGLAFDKNGDLFLADTGNSCVREITGMTTPQTVVGKCTDDLTGSSSTALNNPYGLAFSASGSLFITESALTQNNLVSYNFGANALTLVAGLPSGLPGPYNSSQDGQSGTSVPLNQPLGVTTDPGGNIYLADSQNNVVRKLGTNLSFPNTNVGQTSVSQTVVFSINQTVNLTVSVGTDYHLVSTSCIGSLTTSVGTCTVTITFGPTRSGYRFSPLILRDSISNKLISVQLGGVGVGPLSLLVPGVASTVAHATALRTALAVSTDSAGDAYVLEQGNGSSTADVLFLPVGGGAAQVVVPQGAGMVTPTAMAVDGAGNIFIADSGLGGVGGGNIIRFGADGSVNTAYATGLPGVHAMAVDGFDDLFLAVGGSFHDITEVYAGGQRSSIAGNGTVPVANGVPAIDALFSDPSAIAIGLNGIAVADAGSHYVYLIDNSGLIHIVAGNGTTSTSNAGVALGTGLLNPDGLAIDAAGDIYIADDTANIVYAVYSSQTSIYPVIGTGTAGYTGDGGPSTNATISGPLGIALDGSSDLFVVDSGNKLLREVSYPVTDTISFGNVQVGTTSSPVLQYLANAGNASLTFNPYPFTTTDSHYAVSATPAITTCVATTVSGGVCDIGFTFTPTVSGPAPAGQSNLISNSYNSQQTVIFSTSGSSGYSTVPLPYTLVSQTEVYGNPFTESVVVNNSFPATGSLVFSIGAQTLCTTAVNLPSAGTVNCNAAESGLPVGSYTVNFTFTSTNTFYSSVTGTTTLVIGKAPMTVTPNSFSRPYGQPNPTFTGVFTGEVNGDVFNVTYSTAATQFSSVGNYPITATLTPVGSASLSNYSVTLNTGTLTVTQAGTGGTTGLVVTVNNFSRQYGQPNPTFTGTVTGLLNGDTVNITYSTTATQFSPVGTYPITAVVTGAAAANYVITVNPGTLTINPAGTGGSGGLTVTVNSASRPYGSPNPTFTGTVTGLLNGDTVTVTYSTTATPASPVGTYPITATVTGASASNYVVTVIPGTLTVTTATAPLVVTVNNASRPYGAANPAFTSSVTNALNGDTFTITYSTPATPASPVGNYPINATVTGPAAGNYSITVVPGTLTVTPTAPLTVTINNASRPYGQPNPTFTSTVTGLLNGDTVTITYSTTATQFSPVGTYPITATVSGAAAANYVITVAPATLTVAPAGTGGTPGLTVTVNNASRPYGAANPTFTGTVTGLLNGDTVTVTYSTTATPASPVGTYPITATVSGAAAANYIVTVVPGTLTVTSASAPLVVTVNSASRPYGTANPTFTGTVIGALNGDTFNVTYTTAATIASPVGTYPITATVTGANIANYSVTVVPGTLTITAASAPLVVTVNNANRPFGAANPAFTSTVSGALNGDTFTIAYSTTATVASPIGTYPITATVSGAAAANYNVTVVPGTLTIAPIATTTVATTSASPVTQGTGVTFTATVTSAGGVPTGTVNFCTNGTLPCTSSSSTYLGAGTLNSSGVATYTSSTLPGGSTTITATYQGTTNFGPSSGTVLQVVNPGSFTVTALPPNQSIQGAGSTSYAITLSALQNFTGPVALSCSGLPADATCTFADPIVTLAVGGSATTTLTVVNTAADARLTPPALPIAPDGRPSGLSPFAFAAVFPLGLGAFLMSWSRRRKGLPSAQISCFRLPGVRLLLLLLCAAGIVSLAGCACVTTNYKVYTIPITATSTVTGASTQSASVTLTVLQQ